MIKVTSSSNKNDFYINHKKIELIKELDNNLHIILDNGKTFIVSNSIEDIKTKIIQFENSILYFNKIDKKTTKEVLDNE